jgi:glutathione S-transferase
MVAPVASGEANMAILVHHLENSRSHRVLWLLEELEVPYELKRYQRNPATRLAPPVLRQVHPLGKSPVIEDEGRVVAETGAIVEYLIDRSGGRLGVPTSLMPPLFTKLVLGCVPLFGHVRFNSIERACALLRRMWAATNHTKWSWGGVYG